MSVKIGSCKSDLIFPRIRSPSASPGPRKELTDDRLALSYEALNSRGTPAWSAIRATRSAIIRVWDSLSITHGPAIKNSALPAAGRSDSKENAFDWLMKVTQDSIPEEESRLVVGRTVMHARSAILPGLLVLCLLGAAAFGKAQQDGQAQAEEYIRSSENQWAEAEVSQDSGVAERILADDCVGIAPDGSHYSKAEEIARSKGAAPQFVSN